MLANAQHVLKDAIFLRLDRMPLNEVARRAAAAMLRVRPILAIKARRGEIVVEQAGHDLIAEQLHATIRVVDHEPLVRPKQLVGNHQRTNSVVAGATARIADHMRIAFRETGIFCWVETRVHTSENGKSPRRRESEISLVPEARAESEQPESGSPAPIVGNATTAIGADAV